MSNQWSVDEDNKVRELVNRLGNQWSRIAEAMVAEMGVHRGARSIRHRWTCVLDPELKRGPWSEEEDTKIISLVQEKGHSWSQIAEQVPGRSPDQIRQRYLTALDSRLVSGPWTPAEDQTIISFVETNGKQWSVIAQQLPGRTRQAIRARYLNVLDPALAHPDWTEEQEQQLDRLIQEHGKNWALLSQHMGISARAIRQHFVSKEDELLESLVGKYGKKWTVIAQHMPTMRTPEQLRARWISTLDPSLSQDQWTPEEDQQLTRLVNELGSKWTKIAAEMHGRSPQAVRSRWVEKLNPTLKSGYWAEEEDQQLLRLVDELGKKWTKIAAQMNGRSPQAIRRRYVETLDPTLVRGPWTEQEDQQLIQLVGELGNKWSKIAERMPGRSYNTVRDRWMKHLYEGNAPVSGTGASAAPVAGAAAPPAASAAAVVAPAPLTASQSIDASAAAATAAAAAASAAASAVANAVAAAAASTSSLSQQPPAAAAAAAAAAPVPAASAVAAAAAAAASAAAAAEDSLMSEAVQMHEPPIGGEDAPDDEHLPLKKRRKKMAI